MPYEHDIPYSRAGTSHAAAVSQIASAATIRGMVYRAIVVARGMTCDEIEVGLKLRHQTASARIRDLARFGMIEDSGERRPTRSGRDAIVWRASAAALIAKPLKGKA